MTKIKEKSYGESSLSSQSIHLDESYVKEDRSRLRKGNKKWKADITSKIMVKTKLLTNAISELVIFSQGPARQAINYNQNKKTRPKNDKNSMFQHIET